MSQFFGIIIESLVAVLLLLTILYCARLNSRLRMLKADERAMKSTITELVMSTENAERAIAGLHATLREAEDTLTGQLRDAEIFNRAIGVNLKAGEDVLNRLRKIANAGQILSRDEQPEPEVAAGSPPPPEPAMPDTSAMVAAAQAFAERTRSRVRSIAA